MNIGQAAARSGISAKMIRYYEQIGLLPSPERSESGYRMYDEAHIRTLSFIQHARELGFSSEQMKELLGLWLNTDRQSSAVKQLAEQHIQQLEQKMRDMQQMLDTLKQAVAQCANNEKSCCEILNQIEYGAPQTVHKTTHPSTSSEKTLGA